MKIIHIINSLRKGGAEGNLFRLSKFQKQKYRNKIDIIIITLISNGFYEAELKKLNIKVWSLDLNEKKIFNFFKSILKLRKILKEQNPDIIQSWMYHSNFITLFLPKMFHNRIFWGIRHTKLNLYFSKTTTLILSLTCGLFSRIVPKKIIYNSEASIDFHNNKLFYSKNKTILINNGYSPETYFSSKNLRIKFRKKNNIKKQDIVLGFAGRYVKEKNISSLLIAFSKTITNYSNIYLFMAGNNINSANKELTKIIFDLKITKKVHFMNEQSNLLEFYNGIDMLLLVSHSESFPNVIAEAMLCSTPVLSSNAGCAKKIVNDCGFILNKNDYASIAKNLKKTVDIFKNKKRYWQSLKKKSQNRIKKEYSIEKMSNTYLKKWVFE